MKSFKKACRGQKGFTLIELLVVIIILGVLAAVVTLAVTRFIGKGVRESANAEAITVDTAVISCMAELNADELDAACTWVGGQDVAALCPQVTSGNVTVYASEFLRNQKLKAQYQFDIGGNIIGADPDQCNADTTPWGGSKIVWNTTTGEWDKA
jgi:prepilin-type N-terminal cleavage/methylation domain-containing protein